MNRRIWNKETCHVNKTNHFKAPGAIASVLLAAPLVSHSAIVPDRTRALFFNGNEKFNHRRALATTPLCLPRTGVARKTINSPKIPAILPPCRRCILNSQNPTGRLKSSRYQPRLSLPQDRESLFYFNVREIPPKSDKLIRSSWRCKRVLSFSTAGSRRPAGG